MKRTLVALALATLGSSAWAATSTWELDPAHSSSQFAVKHLVITTVRGQFGKTAGAVQLDDGDVTKSSVEATIDATTIDTRQPDRDKHLKSPDFFDVEKYPTITFKSTKVERKGDGRLAVAGNLTMKGTTRPVVLEVTYAPQAIKDPQGKERRAFSGTTRVNRREFGLNWSKTVEAGPVVADDVDITIDAEVVKKG